MGDRDVQMNKNFSLLFIIFFLAINSLSLCQEKLFPVIQNGKWGFINETGTIVIQPQYLQVSNFNSGFAFVKIGELDSGVNKKSPTVEDRGYINTKGEFTSIDGFLSGFSEAGLFYDERARVLKNGKGVFTNSLWGFIDTSFNPVIDAAYDNAGDFSEGLAWVEVIEKFLFFVVSDKFGYINRKGEMVIPLQFENAGNFCEGYANITLKGKRGFIDKNGKLIVKPRFEAVKHFSNSLAPVKLNGSWGYVDTKDSLSIPAVYEAAFPFNDGLALVKQSGKWGFINIQGKFVLEPQYDEVSGFSEGLAAIKDNGKWGFINDAGKYVIEPTYDYAYGFSNGLALVKVDGKFGYINHNGEYIWTPGK